MPRRDDWRDGIDRRIQTALEYRLWKLGVKPSPPKPRRPHEELRKLGILRDFHDS
jgi:hypothetical protein